MNVDNTAASKRVQDAAEHISRVAKPILWSLGLELVEVSVVGQHTRTVVKLFIDRPEGVTLEDCERAHRALSPALDVADPFPHAYTLEVSSPGLDRPLRRPEDYRRLLGKRVSLKLKEPHHGQWRIVGRIATVDDDAVTVTVEEGQQAETLRCGFERIAKARQEIDFRRPRQHMADSAG
ncbi:MAG TPA: ribosome maturation factor RimP [Nitrospiraceae bacterium]|nr:ribosome maturation factor RimP [Nitrospiraceae bacterium]